MAQEFAAATIADLLSNRQIRRGCSESDVIDRCKMLGLVLPGVEPEIKPVAREPIIEIVEEVYVPAGCRWPFGDPREADFRFCGEPVELGKSYCPTHQKLAYVKYTPGKAHVIYTPGRAVKYTLGKARQ